MKTSLSIQLKVCQSSQLGACFDLAFLTVDTCRR